MRKIRLSETVAKLMEQAPEVEGIPEAEPTPLSDSSRELIAFSKLLNKEIKVRWKGPSPQEVYVDDVPFTFEERERLKSITSEEGLKAALLVKLSFEGKIVE